MNQVDAIAPTDWLTPRFHKRLLWIVMALTALSFGISMLLLQLDQRVNTTVAYHVAGISMLMQVALWIGVCTYGALNSFNKQRRTVLWGGGVANSTLLGVVGVLCCAIPATKIVQAQIWLAGHTMVTVHDGAVRVTGAISYDLDDRIKQAVTTPVRRLELGKNGGGMIAGAMRARPVLHDMGVDEVLIDGPCASSCALLALMFPTRLMATNGQLGYHKLRPAAGNDEATVAADTARVKARLAEAGYPSHLVDKLFSTKQLTWYNPKEARSLGLITGCWDSDEDKEVPCD